MSKSISNIENLVRECIAAGCTDKAIDILMKKKDKLKNRNKIIMFSSRYKANENERMSETIKYEDYRVELNRLNSSILKFLDGIKKNLFQDFSNIFSIAIHQCTNLFSLKKHPMSQLIGK